MIDKKAQKDYYKILNISKNDPEAVITQAYRKLAKVYHPDHNPNNHGAAERFNDISEAAYVLRNPDRRKKYDNQWVENNHERSYFKSEGVFNYFSKSLEELKELWDQAGIECKNAHKKMPLNHIYASSGKIKRKNTNGIHINDII